MKKAAFLVLLVVLGAMTGDAQNDALIIYGKDFSFSIIEPTGWHCYTEDAYRYQLNAYFLYGKATIRDFIALMNIRVMEKHGYTIEQNLSADMKAYSKDAKKISFLEFDVGQLKYKYASKLYLMDDKTTDYCCYLDPGDKLPHYLIFVLHGPKDECKKYEKDFSSLINSFRWLTGNVKGIEK